MMIYDCDFSNLFTVLVGFLILYSDVDTGQACMQEKHWLLPYILPSMLVASVLIL